MTKEQIIESALQETREDAEYNFRQAVKNIIKAIVEQQDIIKKATETIKIYQKQLKELEFEPVADNILD